MRNPFKVGDKVEAQGRYQEAIHRTLGSTGPWEVTSILGYWVRVNGRSSGWECDDFRLVSKYYKGDRAV